MENKVNKSAIMRELHNEAVEIYKNAYEGEYAIEQFLYGAEKLFEKLRQYNVVGQSEQLVAFCRWYNQAIPSYETTEEEIVETYLRESN